MHFETEAIVHAINQLQPKPDNFKDYYLPVVLGFLSASLGGLVAYFSIKYQQTSQEEKEKLRSANIWTIQALKALISLTTIKRHYAGKVNDDPRHRALTVRLIVNNFSIIDADCSSLSFIVRKLEDSTGLKNDWRELTRIQIMSDNYNLILTILDQRNDLIRFINSNYRNPIDHNNGFTMESYLKTIPKEHLIRLIDLTERLIMFTDDILIEVHDFLNEFPLIAEGKINKSRIEKYGKVLKYSDNKESNLLNKTTQVNYSILENLFGIPEQDLRQEYSTGYE